MSNPETTSGLSVEAPTNCSKQIAGLRFAKSFNSFLSFNKALSGFFENSKPSHFGPPTAPKFQVEIKILKQFYQM
jgi:hypothetical protein